MSKLRRVESQVAETVIARGSKRRISFAKLSSGTSPAEDSWVGLSAKQQAPFRVLFEELCDHGRIRNKGRYKRLDGEIWEFKANGVKLRIGCFTVGETTYLTNIWTKKEDVTPPNGSDMKLARRVRVEQLGRIKKPVGPKAAKALSAKELKKAKETAKRNKRRNR